MYKINFLVMVKIMGLAVVSVHSYLAGIAVSEKQMIRHVFAYFLFFNKVSMMFRI